MNSRDYDVDRETPEQSLIAFQKEIDCTPHLHVQTETEARTVTEWLCMDARHVINVGEWE